MQICGSVDDLRYCADALESVALIAIAVVVALALHRILSPRSISSASPRARFDA
ncbi:MAG: hypothetical protein R2748_23690 [Bryobacterales bacterium]